MARWTLIVATIAAVLLSACAHVDGSRPGGGGASGAYVGADFGR